MAIAKLAFDRSLLLLAVLLILLVNINLDYRWSRAADYFIYDQLMQQSGLPETDDIAIIEIDDQSLSLIGEWPWDRAFHAELINILTQANARVVAYNLAFGSGNVPLTSSDYVLAEAIRHNGRVVLPVYFDRVFNAGPLELVLPHAALIDEAELGHVNVYLDGDGVYRQLRVNDLFQQQRWPHFSLKAFNLANPEKSKAYEQEEDLLIRFAETAHPFQHYSFVDVITGEVDPAEFYQKAVFVGVTATSIGDPLITPVSREGRQISAVDINASIYQMFAQQGEIRALPRWLTYLLNTLAILLMAALIPRLPMADQLFFSLLMLALYIGSSLVMMRMGYWYPVAGIGLTLLLIPFAWNVIRLSRLFSYFRSETLRLETTRRDNSFHFPDQLLLKDEHALKQLIKVLGVEHYRLTPDSQYEPDSRYVVQKIIPLALAEHSCFLHLLFKEFGQKEQRQVSLLTASFSKHLSEPKHLSDSMHLADGSRHSAAGSSDIFSRQMSLVQDYQDYIAASQHLFESSIQGLSSAVLVADLGGHLLFHNTLVDVWLELYSGADRNLYNILEHCQLSGRMKWQDVWQQVLVGEQLVAAEARLDRAHHRMDVAINIVCLEDQRTGLPVLVVNISDISQIKKAQRARNEMIDFISHDMRSPIASLQALVRQAEESPDALPLAELLRKVDSHSRRALNFADEFLSLAKVESDDDIQVYDVDLYSVCQNAVDTLYEQAQEKGIEVGLEVDDDCWVSGNGDLLERVMMNLCSNAIKYSPEETRVSVTVARQGDSILVEVADQGPGIPEALLPNLFKSFQRGVGKQEAKVKGLGLGLRFVDVALQRHNSQIQVRSAQSGSTFYFVLKALSL
ncbi:CHASE2 domain-containing protein [Bacterioplanoides sp.]|uniref:CHASE2 domain-containing protein n=1 Tax=Bacterioplanoides sp. TaxID=2066072 RepID=UPI003BAD2814